MKRILVMVLVAVFSFSLAFTAAEAGSDRYQKALTGYNKARPTSAPTVGGSGGSAPAAAGPAESGPYYCWYGSYVVKIASSVYDSRGGASVYVGYWRESLYTPYDDSSDVGTYDYIFYAVGQPLQDLRAARFDSRRPNVSGYALSYTPCEKREYWNGGTIMYVNTNPNAESSNEEGYNGFGKE